MVFLEAAQKASFTSLVAYVFVVLSAHIFRWRKFDHLMTLGMVTGMVVGNGLAAQFKLIDPLAGFASMTGSMLVFVYLFDFVAKRFPLKNAA